MLVGAEFVHGGPAPAWPSGDLRRVFFGLQPDLYTAASINGFAKSLARAKGLRGQPIDMDRLHVSLAILWEGWGPPPDSLIREASAAAGTVARAPFRVMFDEVQNWSQRRAGQGPVVLVGGDKTFGIDLLHDDLTSALAVGGLGQIGPRINPHMTLLWDRVGAALDQAGPFTWTADEFVLIESFHGRSRHNVLASFPLGG